MSAFDTYRTMRDSTLRNGERAREEEFQGGQRNALMSAGQAYATGDTAGASNALATNGLLPQAMQLDNQARSNANADMAAGRADEDRQRATVLAGAQGLMRLPEEQWMTAFTGQVAPALQEVGLGHLVGQIAQDGITRQELEAVIASLGGEVQRGQIVQGQNGQLDRIDPYSNNIESLRPAGRSTPPAGYQWTEGGGLAFIPGGPADPSFRGQQAAASRAPARPRSGGGGGSSGGPSAPAPRPSGLGSALPPGFTIRRR